MNNLVTFFKNFKSLKKYFFEELNRMTNERLLGEILKEYVVKHDLINSKANEELLEKYKKICDKKQ
jgi:hypothetical protein